MESVVEISKTRVLDSTVFSSNPITPEVNFYLAPISKGDIPFLLLDDAEKMNDDFKL